MNWAASCAACWKERASRCKIPVPAAGGRPAVPAATEVQLSFRSAPRRRLERLANQTDPKSWTVAQKMNPSAQPPRTVGGCRAVLRLAFCLIPLAVIADLSVASDETTTLPSRPYLPALGAPGLRFGEPTPPPDLSVRAPVAAPAPTATSTEPTTPSAQNPATKTEAAAANEESPPTSPPTAAANATKPSGPGIPSVLPDETRPKVRPEDFLPYFQFPAPGANPGNVTVVAPGSLTPPAPPSQPPSSATYRQQ